MVTVATAVDRVLDKAYWPLALKIPLVEIYRANVTIAALRQHQFRSSSARGIEVNWINWFWILFRY